MSKSDALKSLMGLVKYDPKSPSGLCWLDGTSVGTQLRGGYWMMGHAGFTFTIHLIIWEMHHGPVPEGMDVDHRDTDKSNNEISNLKLATKAQNAANRSISSRNKTGTKGLTWNEKRQKWRGQVMHLGHHRSYFHSDKTQVEQWLIETREQLHKEFANNG